MGIPNKLRFPGQQRWKHRARLHSTFLTLSWLSREAGWRQLLWLLLLWSFQQWNYSWQPLCTGTDRTRGNINGAQFHFEMGNGDPGALSIAMPLDFWKQGVVPTQISWMSCSQSSWEPLGCCSPGQSTVLFFWRTQWERRCLTGTALCCSLSVCALGWEDWGFVKLCHPK